MNHVALVGRLTQDPEIKELGDGTYRVSVTLAVARDYRNSDGVIDTDFIRCTLWNGIASATRDYCRKGDVIGIRGKLHSRTYETENKEKRTVLEVFVEKVTFITSKKHEKTEEEVEAVTD